MADKNPMGVAFEWVGQILFKLGQGNADRLGRMADLYGENMGRRISGVFVKSPDSLDGASRWTKMFFAGSLTTTLMSAYFCVYPQRWLRVKSAFQNTWLIPNVFGSSNTGIIESSEERKLKKDLEFSLNTALRFAISGDVNNMCNQLEIAEQLALRCPSLQRCSAMQTEELYNSPSLRRFLFVSDDDDCDHTNDNSQRVRQKKLEFTSRIQLINHIGLCVRANTLLHRASMRSRRGLVNECAEILADLWEMKKLHRPWPVMIPENDVGLKSTLITDDSSMNSRWVEMTEERMAEIMDHAHSQYARSLFEDVLKIDENGKCSKILKDGSMVQKKSLIEEIIRQGSINVEKIKRYCQKYYLSDSSTMRMMEENNGKGSLNSSFILSAENIDQKWIEKQQQLYSLLNNPDTPALSAS